MTMHGLLLNVFIFVSRFCSKPHENLPHETKFHSLRPITLSLYIILELTFNLTLFPGTGFTFVFAPTTDDSGAIAALVVFIVASPDTTRLWLKYRI